MFYAQAAAAWGHKDQAVSFARQGLEEAPEGADEVEVYQISDEDLAVRLSYFLWNSVPDTALMDAAGSGSFQSGRMKWQV